MEDVGGSVVPPTVATAAAETGCCWWWWRGGGGERLHDQRLHRNATDTREGYRGVFASCGRDGLFVIAAVEAVAAVVADVK